MIPFQIDRAYVASSPTDPITELCWTAQEILTAHTRAPSELYVLPDTKIDTSDVQLDEEGEDTENKGLITELSTAPVQINLHQKVSLSNAPYILNGFGNLTMYAEAGYVALLGDVPADTAPTKPAFSNLAQLIFRVPNPYQRTGAIYNGATFDEKDRITLNHTDEIAEMTRVLAAVRVGLRGLAVTNPDVYNSLYSSQIPLPVIGHLDEDSLLKFFPN